MQLLTSLHTSRTTTSPTSPTSPTSTLWKLGQALALRDAGLLKTSDAGLLKTSDAGLLKTSDFGALSPDLSSGYSGVDKTMNRPAPVAGTSTVGEAPWQPVQAINRLVKDEIKGAVKGFGWNQLERLTEIGSVNDLTRMLRDLRDPLG